MATGTTSTPLDYEALAPAAAAAGAGSFTRQELSRVGLAAAMMVAGGTAIILLLLPLVGYNSLAHAGPKAVLDGAVIALLIGRRGRWRALALTGVVLGLFLGFVQPAFAPLLAILTLAGLAGAGAGHIAARAGRTAGVMAAAICFELVAGTGMPLRILLGTKGGGEPILWLMWFAEWPLRIGGAATGVWLARRRLGAVPSPSAVPAHPSDASSPSPGTPGEGRGEGLEPPTTNAPPTPLPHPRPLRPPRAHFLATGIRFAAAVVACTVPMAVQNWYALGALAAAYLAFALLAGLGRRAIHVVVGLAWGCAVYAGASYLWHRDPDRVIDLLRTFGLRFAPMALAAGVIVTTVRPVDAFRLMRRLRLSGLVLLPLAKVLRSVPQARRELAGARRRLRAEGVWTGPMCLVRRPRRIIGGMVGPLVRKWAGELAEK